MQQFLPFIVIGLATGAVYGLAGVGLVLTYKTSGIFNLGYGAIAAVVAFVFYFLHTVHGMPWPWAAVLSIGIFAPIVGLLLEVLAQTLDGATETLKVVATVGLILIVEAISTLWHPLNEPIFPNFLPQATVKIFGVYVTWDQIILFAFSLVASMALYWFFQSVRLGVLMRGVVDNPELISMSGANPVRVRRWAWVIGTVFAGIAGVMLAPSQPLDGVTIATLVFAAFGAAAIGVFTNLPLTFAGGLIIGVAGALADKYAATISWVGGLPASLPFLILFLVLIFTPARRLAVRRVVTSIQARRSYQAPRRVRLIAGVVAIVLLGLLPQFQGSHLVVWSGALIDVILFLSLGLLVRRSGQISLCQLAFAAVGAATFGHFAVADGMPWFVALLLATLVAVPVGALIAIPAVRVSGVFLALATLGFGILAQDVFYTRSWMFTSSALGVADPRPDISIGGWHLASSTGFYYLLLIIVVVVVMLVVSIGNGRLGRLLEALSDSPLALETQGTTSSVLKVIVFCIAAAMASMAGALTGMLYHYSVGSYFEPFSSIYMVAIVVIITIGEPWYALIAAVGYAVLPGYIQGATTQSVLQLLFGVGAVIAAYGARWGAMPARMQALLDRWGGRRPLRDATVVHANGALGIAPGVSNASETVDIQEAIGSEPRFPSLLPSLVHEHRDGLSVSNLRVVFGGVKAVNGVSIQAPLGSITGLLGPNGAGKTTTFNACSGLNRPTSGEITFRGTSVSRLKPARRARLGLGRTFQRTELFNSLTVRQNVAMGREASLAGANPFRQIMGSRASDRIVREAVERALELTSTAQIAEVPVGLLSTGQRRLVELARALAGPFELLLLDEPSSGLDGHETEQFGRVLRTVVSERSCGILLVEHDMTLVRQVCDKVYVLDFGQVIFEGRPEEMERSEQVRAAYLGDVAVQLEDEATGDNSLGAVSANGAMGVVDGNDPLTAR